MRARRSAGRQSATGQTEARCGQTEALLLDCQPQQALAGAAIVAKPKPPHVLRHCYLRMRCVNWGQSERLFLAWSCEWQTKMARHSQRAMWAILSFKATT